jgi:glucuronate isomerase
MKVEVVGTTDDPTDDLSHHLAYQKEGLSMGMYPTFRPDKAFAIGQPQTYSSYLRALGTAAGI